MTNSRLKYPTYNSQKEIWTYAVTIALLVYLFLTLFQPFGTYNYSHASKYLLLVPYAVIAFITFLVGDYLFARLFSKWTWKNEISKNAILLLCCSLFNYWYSIYFINDASFNVQTLFYMILFTYALGLPICTIAVLAKYSFLKNNEEQLNASKANAEIENKLSIIPDIGVKIKIAAHNFLYAQSEGNYTSIFYLNNGKTEKKLLRISLKNLEEQICNDEIIRCHRSYILNTQNAINKQGNAQGFKISIKLTDGKIPVSRKYIDRIHTIPY